MGPLEVIPLVINWTRKREREADRGKQKGQRRRERKERKTYQCCATHATFEQYENIFRFFKRKEPLVVTTFWRPPPTTCGNRRSRPLIGHRRRRSPKTEDIPSPPKSTKDSIQQRKKILLRRVRKPFPPTFPDHPVAVFEESTNWW